MWCTISHNLLLLLLLTFSSLSRHVVSSEPVYHQQVIVILEDESSNLQKAGRLLYQKHDTLSHVLMLNGTARMLNVVEWNDELELYEVAVNNSDPRSLPIGAQKPFKWLNTLIHVAASHDVTEPGHVAASRDVTEPGQTTTLSAEELATLILVQLTNGEDTNINVISSSHDDASSKTEQTETFLNQFMSALQLLGKFNTSVTFTSTIITLDHSGRVLTGGLQLGINGTDIEWKHNGSAVQSKWVGYFTGETYQVQLTTTTAPVGPNIGPSSFGILPQGAAVHITDYTKKSGERHPLSYMISDKEAFEWVDKIAESTHKNTPRHRALSSSLEVQLLPGNSEIIELSIIEIGSIQDLLMELRHYASTHMDSTVYYRFGEWVLSMNETTFYVSVVGIVVDPSDSDDKRSKVQSILETWQPIPELYPNMQPNTGGDFFDDVTHWIKGERSQIGLEFGDAYNAQCGVAMFLSESIRCFHTHVTNMMSLRLAQNGYLSKEVFFSSHPMACKGTWQITSRNGRKKTGMDMLRDKEAKSGKLPNPNNQIMFDEIVHRISRISKTWLSHVDDMIIKGSREQPPATKRAEYTGKSRQASLLQAFEDIGSTVPDSNNYLRTYELFESVTRLLSSNISEPETRAVTTQIEDYSFLDDDSLPLKASIAIATDHAYVSDLIGRELHLKEQQTGKQYQIVPDSVEVEEDSDIVRFFVREMNNVSSELEQITTAFDQSKLNSKALLEKLLSLSNKTKPYVEDFKKVEKFTDGVIGLVGSIRELENGQYWKGAIDLGKSLKTLGDVTGISKAAEKYLGKALKKLAGKAGESVAGSLVTKVEGSVMSTIGDFKQLEEDLKPFIGALFGIYNIYEDLKRHSTIGYIDAAFDLATTVLSLFGPEAEPFELALSIIKMAVDIFYTDISKELHALPKDASVGQIVVAVLKGIVDTVVDILRNIWDNINPFVAISNANKLDAEYNKDRAFLEGVANYNNYYHLIKENGTNATEINFAGGADSWNGGDITFNLGDDGHSTLSVLTTNTNGHEQLETHDIDTHGVEDIVLGIGETHTVSFRTVSIKFFWLIPVDKKRIISGIDGDKQTLHGTYYGNSHNNKFIAVQELPPQTVQQLGYNLHDYHYTLYGGGGNDSFYLGPQPTYVEGNEGSDAYFINSTSTFTEINSHAGDGQSDTMIIDLNYDQITAQRSGLHLNLTSSNTHRIVILNWFHDVTHQRVIFKTADGVLFKVSATITEAVELIPYALSGTMATEAQVLDAREVQFSEVAAISGSDFNDVIHGNDLDNQMNGEKGDDTLTGGDGRDTYTVDLNKGTDVIDNFATDGSVDSLVVGAKLDQLVFTCQSDDLYITYHNLSQGGQPAGPTSTLAIVKNWFLNDTHRHMVVVTEDKEVVKVSSIKSSGPIGYQPLIVNMSQIEEVADGESYTRILDLNSSPYYADVTSVYGTRGNDYIVGNGKGNYITGETGFDHFEGREGADTYIIKAGDGAKTISNCAKDTDEDTLLFGARFDDIEVGNSSLNDLLLSGEEGSGIGVTLLEWFNGSECQHMTIRSIDGVTFDLPNNTQSLTKTARAIDNSNLTSDVELILTGEWEHVERVTGSQGNDNIIGNSLDNYIDSGLGNSYLHGGNGSDTYVIRSTYGAENIINNFAEDDKTDTILFLVPFLTIEIAFIGMDVRLTSLSSDGLVGVRLVEYNFEALEHARHLIITTSDGISFVLPVTNASSAIDYKPVPVSINQAQVITGQHLNVTAYSSFSEVRTVYGSSRYQNTIIGNQQNNTLVGGAERDLLQGLDGDDILKGGYGNDIIEGGRGSDTLVGGDGDDSLDGGEDNDVISPGTGVNIVTGGPGIDTVIYSGDVANEAGVMIDLTTGVCIHNGHVQDSLTGIENAYGTEYDDILQGDDEDNVLVGQGGNDYLSPGTGYDLLDGGAGNDTYDLTDANGTVTILNYATDGERDLVVMGYTNLSHVWFEVAGSDVIVRAIDVEHPVFYDGNKPAIVFKRFMTSELYQHISMETADGNVTDLYFFILANTQDPTNTPTPPGVYAALFVLVLSLCVLGSCVVLGVYKKTRSRRTKIKMYMHLIN